MSATATAELPLIDSFKTNLEAAAIAAGEAANTRSIAAQAYLYALPPFLFMRQLTEFLQARRYMSPGEFPAGGWVLVRKTSDPTTTTVMPNVDTAGRAAAPRPGGLLVADHVQRKGPVG